MKDKQTRRKIIKNSVRIIGLLGIALVLFLVLKNILPDLIMLLKKGNMEDIEAYVDGMGYSGLWVIALLLILQTMTIVFPSLPIVLCSGIIYGKFLGTAVCYVTNVLVSIAMFFASRKMREFADSLFEHKESGRMGKLLENTKHPALLTILLCMLPVFPNGAIPYVAARSKISDKDFVKTMLIGRFPGTFLTVWCGDLIMDRAYKTILILALVVLFFFLLVWIFKKNILRKAESLTKREEN